MEIISKLIKKIQENYILYFELIKQLGFFFILPVGLIIVMQIFGIIVGFNFIDILRNGIFNFNLSIAKFLLSVLGLNTISHDIVGIVHVEGRNIFTADFTIVALRYYFISLLIFSLSVKRSRDIVFYIIGFFIIMSCLSAFFMVIRVVAPSIIFSGFIYSLLFEGSLVIILIIMPLRRYFEYRKFKMIDDEESDGNRLNMCQLHVKTDLFYWLSAGLGVFFLYLIYRLYIYPHVPIVDTVLLGIIVNISALVLKLFSYSPEVFGQIIKGDGANIYIAASCLGKDLMMVYAAIILLVRSKAIHKTLFIPIGIGIIILLNIFRVVLLYIYLSKTGNIYMWSIDVHDLLNYPVYIAIVVLWYLYIRKYSVK